MPPKHVHRIRKQKARARNESASSNQNGADSNVPVLPSRPDSADEVRASLLAALKTAQPAKVSSKKAKRLEHYIDTKLKKEENQDLIRKLAGQGDVDRTLFRSSKDLGRVKETKREALRRALEEEKRGLGDHETESKLYQKRRLREISEDEGDADDELPASGMLDASHSPASGPTGLGHQTTGLFGTGLKRPLEVDETGRPQIKKRKRRKASSKKGVLFRVEEEDYDSEDEQHHEGNGSGSDEWNGFSDEEHRSEQHTSEPILGIKKSSKENLSESERSSDEDNESTGGSEDEDESGGSSEDEDEDNSSASSPLEDGPSRTSLFKQWAEQQRNKALGYAPASNISDISAAQPAVAPQQKPFDAITAPAVGPLRKDADAPAAGIVVNRSENIQEARMKLPVVQEEQQIMEAIHRNSITIVCGATGSGKTTQVPQMMFESGYGSTIGQSTSAASPDKRTKGMIGVTQPRRVAATSVADRVATEMGDMRNRVGHQVRFDSAVGPSTAIKFMTDGILLREVANDFTLSRYSAIVIDEAHERSVNTDILIGLLSRIVELREDLSKEKPDDYYPLKLVIMSATMRVEDFTRNTILFKQGPPPIVQAEGRQYPVVNHFARQTKRDYLEEMFSKVSRGHRKLPKGGILVFLTGQAEILTLMKRLQKNFANTSELSRLDGQRRLSDGGDARLETETRKNPSLAGEEESDEEEITGLDEDDDQEFHIDDEQPDETVQKIHVLPLYSQLPAQQQSKVFEEPPEGSRLVVLATNVAETSLTIPGIRYVFDCGRAKEKQYDTQTGVQTFEVNWISKASASQRAGRAGRTGPGHCYRLYSSAVFERDFVEYTVPEILRSPVENIALMVKGVDFPNVASFPFPTPPDRHALAKAEQLLKYLAAIDRTGKITDTGRALTNYPVNPRYGRMLLLAASHGLLAHTIALVSALAIPELLLSQNQVAPHLTQTADSDSESESDVAAARREESAATAASTEKLKAYKAAQATLARWDAKTDALKLLTAFVLCSDPDLLASRCENLFVREKGMREALELRSQLVRIVQGQMPTLSQEALTKLPVLKDEQRAKLKYILAAGFADQVAIRKDLLGEVGEGRKPRRAIEVPYRTLTRSYEAGPRTEEEARDVFLHPSSVLSKVGVREMPPFVVYSQLSRAAKKVVGGVGEGRTRMHPLTTVSAKQLIALMEGTELLEVGKPIGKVEAAGRGDDGKERRECWVGVHNSPSRPNLPRAYTIPRLLDHTLLSLKPVGTVRIRMGGTFDKVIIVGAGPSGLLLALLLAKKGISVEILEAADQLDSQPRAAHYGPPAMPELRRAGVLDEIRRRGMVLNTMCWRNFDDHTEITGIDNAVLADVNGEDQRTTCLVLQELDNLLLEEFLTKYNGKVSFKHKVTGIGQDEKKSWVDVDTPEGGKRLEADYIVGCDGANSQIRRSLFGDLNYPGRSWDDHQIVATNTYYDFKKYGWQDANFIIHPEHFYMAAIIQEDGLYRITYGEKPGLSRDQLKERMEWKFKTMLPGHPDPDQYKVVNFSPYKMHQRCAEKFRVGRFLLAADAAHLCNPWGGMGITGGFVDVGGLYDCLAGIWDGSADEDILDLYSAKRIEKWKTVIDPVSSENFRRVHDKDPKSRFDRDEFMQMCTKAKGDEDFAREMLLGSFAVRYDFTQHYRDKLGTKDFKDDVEKIHNAGLMAAS
ncbi:hypothetical protein CAC42_3692 [Sphaceloma murrayae]|uniref:RNA helicase n=1 Tax=Sphaceloma murrayae TaxID=2082308 RepID=A0A2K1QGW0_9PEZI|nr:hypothetical protein CAC42_3692 [Sphaceloma murrayae]